jgi:hypothetical protein
MSLGCGFEASSEVEYRAGSIVCSPAHNPVRPLCGLPAVPLTDSLSLGDGYETSRRGCSGLVLSSAISQGFPKGASVS